MTPPPPGMEIFGWLIWGIFIIMIVAGVLLVLKSMFPSIFQQTEISNIKQSSLDEAMQELLQEIRMLRREIEELRRELKE